MGEAKRKRRRAEVEATTRPWATGVIRIVANDRECFSWSGTRQEAIELEKRFLDAATALGDSAYSCAVRTAGYLMCFGMPRAGMQDLRPSRLGDTWDGNEIEALKAAVLWLVLREHVPNTGQKVEDVFVGKSLAVWFRGDRREIFDASVRELRGQPFDPSKQFEMSVGVLYYHHHLDPAAAVTMLFRELQAMAGYPPLESDSEIFNNVAYMPRVLLDATEAKAMLQMTTISLDATDPAAMTNPQAALRTYVGYTEAELRGGKPGVLVR
jgi:hypothetical protein